MKVLFVSRGRAYPSDMSSFLGVNTRGNTRRHLGRSVAAAPRALFFLLSVNLCWLATCIQGWTLSEPEINNIPNCRNYQWSVINSYSSLEVRGGEYLCSGSESFWCFDVHMTRSIFPFVINQLAIAAICSFHSALLQIHGDSHVLAI